ncbi:Uncharacterised protein [Serratia quinivorans]|nr:Uncharacterised protein [Serratia quinivorans]CAI0773860.1 Uncharacterised protein [Serratia quinivorans]CAI0795512.1 Uncharacterised protein [Serratia quinivorans]CAI1704594.1 Uncharacterised protein [Serratia quinivorans]CAI2060333.1 Uncharacterised protein [Serratia quinivorans]
MLPHTLFNRMKELLKFSLGAECSGLTLLSRK